MPLATRLSSGSVASNSPGALQAVAVVQQIVLDVAADQRSRAVAKQRQVAPEVL
jgi:hypothetical protein